MNLNLALPYDPKPSPPHDAALVFYSPHSEDLLFPKLQEIEFCCQAGYRNVGLKWILARNEFKQSFHQGEAIALPGNRFAIRIRTEKLIPAFYDLRVELDLGNGTQVAGVCTFGFRVDEIAVTLDRPADFLAFWGKARRELASLSTAEKLSEFRAFSVKEINEYNRLHAALPGDYDPSGHRGEEVEACKIDFATVGGLRIHGYLAKPKGAGPFPAMLVLPGAGFAARPMPLEQARHGYIALDIQVHGQEVDLEKYPRLPGYYDQCVYEPVEAYYYHKVYLSCIQALNYLATRVDVDTSRIVAVGGSQGGRLGIVLAALDSRVSAVVAAIVNGGNVPYNRWAAAANAATPPSNGMNRAEPPALTTAEGRCLAYYDPMNFAPEVRCPVLMNAGLIDPVSPPSEVFPIHRLLGSSDKTIVPLPGLGHDWSAEFDRRAWRWLDRVLKIAPHVFSPPASAHFAAKVSR